jgi:hypothetical protein
MILVSYKIDVHSVSRAPGAIVRRRRYSPAVATIPVRPAAYIRDADATTADDSIMTHHRESVASAARRLGWPVPALYADAGAAGPPGGQYLALMEAIAAGRHDAVIIAHPIVIGSDLAQIEAFDRHCRQHAVRLCFRRGQEVTDPRALFDVIRDVTQFTVTDEHLRLLRRAYVTWDDCEFGAPEIDCKRPYGNSNVPGDIAEILGVPDSEWADEDLNPIPDAEWRFVRLHVETAIVLQIALATGEFRTGRYVREEGWDINWRRDES